MITNYLNKMENYISINNKQENSFVSNKYDQQIYNQRKIENREKLYDKILDSKTSGNSQITSNQTLRDNNNTSNLVHLKTNSNTNASQSSAQINKHHDFKGTLQENNRSFSKNKSKNNSLSPNKTLNTQEGIDIEMVNSRIKNLNIKNMNYRYEITKLREALENLEKSYYHLENINKKLEKLRENDAKYILKMESMITYERNEKFNQKIVKNIETKHIGDNFNFEIQNSNLKFNDKNSLSIYVENLLEENSKLKNFKKNVYELSTRYDEVNSYFVESLIKIQNFVNEVKSSNRLEAPVFFTFDQQFKNLVENLQVSVELKQTEFNILVSSKNDEINILNQELIRLKSDLDIINRDRIQDQKIINELQTQNTFLNMKMNEIMKDMFEVKEVNRSQKDENVKVRNSVEPMKKSAEKILRNLEKNLNLNDRNNLNFVEELNYKLNF